MDKINFENLPSRKTPLSAEVLNQLQTNIENSINQLQTNIEKHILTAGISSNITINSTAYIALTLTEVNKIGDKLTLENGKIKIGSGVSYVKISSNVMFNASYTAGDKLATAIQKNGENVAVTGDNAYNTRPYITLNCGPKLITVNEGDLISLCVRNETGARGTVEYQDSATNITVEVI